MKKRIIILLTFFLPVLVFGQQEVMKFKKTTHDFGTIKEEGGSVTHVFEFENIGEIPILIRTVEASCGCTTPAWTKEPVLPGETGIVKVTYNPINRPNKFTKTANITTNVGSKRLIIKGFVTPRPKSLSELYPKKMEQLRLKTSYVMFNEIGNGKVGKLMVEAVNDSNDIIKVKFGDTPSYITVSIDKVELKPKEKATIEVIYNAKQTNFWGFHSDIIPVYVDEVVKSSNSLIVTATVIEDFSDWTDEQISNGPVVGIDKLEAQFVSALSGDLFKAQFKITNVGKQPLILRKIDTSSDFLEVKPTNTVIQPNTQGLLNVTFKTKGKKGYQNQQITIITNAPELPVFNLRVSGFVE
ncbi:uncharacterized protein DUF1573 [Balneicella halophila]|uniref:Uncharacterized protein DUF1573 n=1 Tax=Balneicella halophila TaxID=1537566 RepID=A0A7L4UP42_BALHA|nr:DUF1573 domain-containing protein [Balneicella halophila]PVX49833.1 uncharacterized protein DUF1573 [Balneicella halophila]